MPDDCGLDYAPCTVLEMHERSDCSATGMHPCFDVKDAGERGVAGMRQEMTRARVEAGLAGVWAAEASVGAENEAEAGNGASGVDRGPGVRRHLGKWRSSLSVAFGVRVGRQNIYCLSLIESSFRGEYTPRTYRHLRVRLLS